ncbi:MAG: glycosyltransferase family 2 protein, partial [Halobacteriaceae archaeon]
MGEITHDIALGTKVFSRTEDLQNLLDSIPDWISKVYIADDGEITQTKSTIYNGDYPFKLELIDLEYDAGVGAGRNAIVDAVTEDYIFIVDPDHQMTPTMGLLYEQMKRCPEIGGLGAVIVEPENDRLYSQAADFREVETEAGTKLIRETRGINNNKEIQAVYNAPVVKFDFIP